ncbi:MAG: hypothetical protein MUE42_00555 [Opitutaceae bacterium]|jgi:hypothetical protein|nr:hypothetical protein [Opitutaceae bacterium]
MSITFYHILHVLSVLVLTGFTFYAFAAPAETRKKVMIITGIASLVIFVSGFGLITKVRGVGAGAWPLWVWVKLVAWLGLSALAGVGYRKREKVPVFMTVALVLVFAAVYSVYSKIGGL